MRSTGHRSRFVRLSKNNRPCLGGTPVFHQPSLVSLLKVLLLIVVTLADLYAVAPDSVRAQSTQGPGPAMEFSARVVWQEGEKSSDALIFARPDRYRLEHRGGVETDMGNAGVTIVRRDQHEAWYILSKRRMYLAVPLKPSLLLPFQARLEGEIHRTLVGDSVVGARSALLYEVVVERYGRRETFFEWVDVEQGLLLKLVSKHRPWSVEYQHVVFSKQPGFYFEVPRGYKRVDAREESLEER